jgi:hypothetical protein
MTARAVVIPTEAAICDWPVFPAYGIGRNGYTQFSPTVIVFTVAAGMYYITAQLSQSPASSYATGAAALIFTMVSLQIIVMYLQPNCTANAGGIVFAILWGAFVGVIGYYIARAVSKDVFPIIPQSTNYKNITNQKNLVVVKENFTQERNLLAVDPVFTLDQPLPDMCQNCKQFRTADHDDEHCAAVDGHTYVVDMYKNGKLVNQAITEQAASTRF